MRALRCFALLALLLAGCPGESTAPPGSTGGGGGAPPPVSPDQGGAPAAASIDPDLLKWAQRTFAALPAEASSKKNPVTEEKVALGRMLYFDARISRDQQLACVTCHDPGNWGIDPRPENAISKGPEGGTRNAPTVFNAALQTSQFWDGREADVEGAVKAHLTDPTLMGMADEAAVVAALKAIPGYAEPFQKAFPGEDPITADAVSKAIGAYVRRLLTPGRFDKLLGGDGAALSPLELEGLAAFKQVNCNMCHIGSLVGGNMSQKLGLMSAWEGNPDTGAMFKVPNLRNVAKTGPYMHDGSIASLEEVVVQMAKYQLGKQLNPQQTKALLAFLEALTCDLPPAELLTKPDLPQ